MSKERQTITKEDVAVVDAASILPKSPTATEKAIVKIDAELDQINAEKTTLVEKARGMMDKRKALIMQREEETLTEGLKNRINKQRAKAGVVEVQKVALDIGK